EVNQQSELLAKVFGLPITDPKSMPVTRDLSDAKRAMLVKYLGAQISAEPSPTVVSAAPHGGPVIMRRKRRAAPAMPAAPAAPPPGDGVTTKDSKTLAMRSRLGNRSANK